MTNEISKHSEIRFKIGLDKQNVPLDIKWMASDSQMQELRDCKSIMLSIWDAAEKNTLKIDLWTSEMTIDEMHAHFFQTIASLADSYERATKNPHAREEVKKFLDTLTQKTADWENGKTS